jgi:membrane complex biogenesis BtpA family protein
MGRFTQLFPRPKPLIGVIHLPPLPGYAASPGLERVIEKALEDLRALEAGGADGALAENEEDRPHQVEAAPETIAAMTRVSRELVLAARSAIVGVEILLNDPWASLAVAMMSGARFVRTDYFVDPMERAEYGGPMRIDPVGLQAYRSRIGAEGVLILADVQVKYARMMEARPLAESARLAREHRADAILVTGRVTGDPPRPSDVKESKAGAADCPVLIGSGLDARNARELLSVADGAIVGTSLKTGEKLDPDKVKNLVAVARALERGE